MSSETFYSPELTIQKSNEIISECNKIIEASVAEKRRLNNIARISRRNYNPEMLEKQNEWKQVGGTLYGKIDSNDFNVNASQTEEISTKINDSMIINQNTDELVTFVSDCIPKTNRDFLEKERLLNRYYSLGEKVDARLKVDIVKFCNQQKVLSADEEEIIDRYFVLKSLSELPLVAKSVEEMPEIIIKLEKAYKEKKQKDYISKVLFEVLERVGYKIISGEAEMQDANMVLPSGGKVPVNCYFSALNNGFLLESLAVVKASASISNDDRENIVARQNEICAKNNIIEQLCLEQGVICKKISMAIPDKESIRYSSGHLHRRRTNNSENREWTK